MKHLLITVFLLFLLFGCKDSSDSGSTTKSSSETEQSSSINSSSSETQIKRNLKDCIYFLDKEKSKVLWKAYKTSAKIGVGGEFDNIVYNVGVDTIRDMKSSLIDSRFMISPMQVNSGNKERDAKLVKYFFNGLGPISGKFATVQDNGTGLVQLVWNGQDKTQPFKYEVDADTLWIITTINFKQWKAQKNADKLNKVCKKLHAGKDGKSILWPDVDVRAKVVFKKYCG